MSRGIDDLTLMFNLRESADPAAEPIDSPFQLSGQYLSLVDDESVQTYLLRVDWVADWNGVRQGDTWRQLGLQFAGPVQDHAMEATLSEGTDPQTTWVDILSVSVVPKGAEYGDSSTGVRTEVTVTGSVAADRTNIFYVIDGAAAKQMSVYGYNRHTTPLMLDDRWLAWLDVPGAGAKSSPDAPRRLRLYDRWRLPLGVSAHEEYPELVVEYTRRLEEQRREHQALAKRFTRSTAAQLTSEQLRTLQSLGYIR